MAEQHGTPEQAAAGKSHGGLGGGYKVPGGEGCWGIWAHGCSWSSSWPSLGFNSPLFKMGMVPTQSPEPV